MSQVLFDETWFGELLIVCATALVIGGGLVVTVLGENGGGAALGMVVVLALLAGAALNRLVVAVTVTPAAVVVRTVFRTEEIPLTELSVVPMMHWRMFGVIRRQADPFGWRVPFGPKRDQLLAAIRVASAPADVAGRGTRGSWTGTT